MAQLIVTIIIASQGMFYILAAAEGMKNVSVETFAEQRKAIDIVIANRIKILYYTALLLGIINLFLLGKISFNSTFICTLIATVLILADIIIALKFNVPINKAFAEYPLAKVADWRALQLEWLKFIVIRGVLSIAAMLLLLFSWK